MSLLVFCYLLSFVSFYLLNYVTNYFYSLYTLLGNKKFLISGQIRKLKDSLDTTVYITHYNKKEVTQNQPNNQSNYY